MKQGDLVNCSRQGVANPCRITLANKNVLTIKDNNGLIHKLDRNWFSIIRKNNINDETARIPKASTKDRT